MGQSIQHYFSQSLEMGKLSEHLEEGKEILSLLLPEGLPDLQGEEADRWLTTHLPLVKWEVPASAPALVSVYFLCSPPHEFRTDQMLLHLIRRWLIPEKEIHIAGFNNLYFYQRAFSSRLLFIAEVKVMAEEVRDLSTILDNLPHLANELSLCLTSSRYRELQLSTKALSLDQKSTQIQGYLRKFYERIPNVFDIELFGEMSRFFALSKQEFRRFRTAKHLTRVILSHALMKKRLLHHLSISPEKRHLHLYFIRSKLRFPFGQKSVLGLSVAIGLRDRYETFDEKHIIDAAQEILPNIREVKNSYYFSQINHDPIKYLYLELERRDGIPMTQEEIKKLKDELQESLKKRVERLIPSVFMIRNEEEVMRNIFLLSQELHSPSDLPQIMIHFEKQEGDELFFTLIAVRVRKRNDSDLETAFQKLEENTRFIADRVQNVGYIRKKNLKEANVFRLCIRKDRSILRADSSVNFYLARKRVLSAVHQALGEVRDYNGGMLLKQGELFSQLRDLFPSIKQRDQELLESFFFSLVPIEAQATTFLPSLKTLFEMVLEGSKQSLPKRDSCFQKVAKHKNVVFAVLKTKDPSFEAMMNERLSKLENFSKSLIKSQIKYQGTCLQAFLYENTSQVAVEAFQRCIHLGVAAWRHKVKSQQELRLSFADPPQALDPRLSGDEYSSNLMKMLFEGLARIDQNSKPALAIAQSVEISPDQKEYTFKLRPSKWSNGTPLTSHDFEYAWKKILSPSFYTPFAYFFYPIKNARAAKEGEVELESVGIHAVDDTTLVVKLETPTPEFLEQTAHTLYSPVNRQHDQIHPNWSQDLGEGYVCNGLMMLSRALPNGGYEFVKNPFYWDVTTVKLNRISITKNSSKTAFEMFKNDETDWLGHPIRPWESFYGGSEEPIHRTKALGAHWCVFNTQRYPFDHLKMRQALSFAIDRSKLSPKLANASIESVSPLPLIHSSTLGKSLVYGDSKYALQLFEEALTELGIQRGQLPVITLIYSTGDERAVAAKELVRQWREIFGIQCRTESMQFHDLFPKLVKGDYQVGTINWKSWISDPFYTLNTFQYRSNKVNFSKWESQAYQALIQQAYLELDPKKRARFIRKAEQLLIEACPVFPIHHQYYQFLHKKQLTNVFCSDAGNIDFKWASIQQGDD